MKEEMYRHGWRPPVAASGYPWRVPCLVMLHGPFLMSPKARLGRAKMETACRDFVVCTVTCTHQASLSISVTLVTSPHEYF